MSAEAHDNPPTQAAPAEAIADLAARIARWLPTARWFPGKDRAAGSVRVIDRIEIPGTGGLAVALVDSAGAALVVPVDPLTGRDAAADLALAAALAMVPASLVLAVPSGSIRLFLAAAVASIVYVVASIRFAVRRDDASARVLLFTSLGSLLGLLTAAVAFGRPV